VRVSVCDIRYGEEATAAADAQQQPDSQSAAHHHHHPRRVHGLLDPVARPLPHHRLLVRARHAVVLLRADSLRHLLLDLLPEQPHQPVLLRLRQPAVQEDVHSHHSARLATLVVWHSCAKEVMYSTLEFQQSQNVC